MCADNKDNVLRLMTEEEVIELLELYKTKYGDKNFQYLLMYNQCKWNKKLRELGVDFERCDEVTKKQWISFRKAFYTPRNSDFRKFGTYISIHFDIMQSVSFNSWEPGLHELYACLESTKLIDWKSGPLLTNVYLEYCEKVKQIAAEKGVGVQRARLCHGLIMPHEKALSLEVPRLPEGYKMEPLREEHADQIHECWTNKKEGSLVYIRGLITVNKTYGIFDESSGELVSWIFQNDFSGLGILEVLPNFRRQGFGSLLAIALSKCIATSELVELSAYVIIENYKSKTLLEKVGFEKSILNEWIQLDKV